MPTAETNVRPSEQELVESWRAMELERAGYPAEAAAELAARTDVDLHRAVELLSKGCSTELALHILRQRSTPEPGPLVEPGSYPWPAAGSCPSGPSWQYPHRARLDPQPVQRCPRSRAADAPPLRADAPRRDPRGDLAHREALDGARRRVGARHPRRRLGCRLRGDRREDLPRPHVVERGAE